MDADDVKAGAEGAASREAGGPADEDAPPVADAPDAGAPEGTAVARRFAWVRRHRWAAAGAAAVVVAAGVVVPWVAFGDAVDAEPCWRVPAATRALADDPAAATKALDPGENLERLDAVKELLDHPDACGAGDRVLGQVITAATRARTPDTPHTPAQARSAFAAAAAFDGGGTAAAVARMLAEYGGDLVGNCNDLPSTGREPIAGAVEDKDRYDHPPYWIGDFPALHDAHVNFGRSNPLAYVSLEAIVTKLATDPEAFAVLHNAIRAHFAYYLEHLTEDDITPRKTSLQETYYDARRGIEDTSWCMGALQSHRTRYAQDGTLADPGAFDRAVRARLKGSFRAAPKLVTARAPAASVAARRADAALHGDPFEARSELFTVLDTWARQRKVPEETHQHMRWLIDKYYIRGMRNG